MAGVSMSGALAELRAREERAIAGLAQGASGLRLALELSAAMDAFLVASEVVARRAVFGEGAAPFATALVAVGGLSRRERSPKSDVDFLLLHAAEGGANEALLGRYSDAFLYPLWDAKLDLGHGVRTVDETLALFERDEAALTSHLDARLLAGDEALFRTLEKGSKKAFAKRGGAYVTRLLEPIRERGRAESLVFVLEPHLKTGPGGLRDIHQIQWVSGFRFGRSDLQGLVELRVLSEREHRQLLAARSFYLRTRAFLHMASGRRQDQITFELHRELAERVYAHGSPRDAVEQLLGRHYNHAQQVIDIKHRVFTRIDEELRPKRSFFRPKQLEDGFIRHNGRLSISDPRRFFDHPRDVLRIFHSALLHGLSISDFALDALLHSSEVIDDALRADRECAEIFWRIVEHKDGDRALVDMFYAGVLGRYLPEFGRTRGMVQADFYHSHTVDVHSLRVIELLYGLRRGDGPEPFATLTRGEPQFRSLVMGALFHDAGKRSGRDHAIYGAELVQAVMRRLGATEEETTDAAILVREHLTMPKLSQRRDLSDAAMIASFAQLAQDAGRLTRLYVLSYIDTHGTGPTLWTPWKAALLHELYEKTGAVLASGAAPSGEAAVPARMAEIFAPAELERLMQAKSGDGDAFFGAAEHGHLSLYMVSRDRPGLVAVVAGVCAEHRMSIASADLFSSDDGWALDRFRLRGEAARAEAFLGALRRTLADRAGLAAYMARRVDDRRPRRSPALMPEVRVQLGEASAVGQVVDVFAPDRAGLLFDLSRAIFAAGYSIVSARVSTEGNRAVDAFYVRPAGDAAVTLTALKDALAAAAG
ncbi:MAG: ACT domain-containing protein [Deltaproteobacteria bacterium]|nr:ACT domain-containing protein [Deltaproteobacteria bacterium]